MKVIRAERLIHVPVDPENPDKSIMRPVHAGLVALVPDNYKLPEGSARELGSFKEKKKGKEKEDE